MLIRLLSKHSNMTFLLKSVLILLSVISLVSASAIPMWEYLTKDEKMTYLYNMFANQVQQVCNGPKYEECTKELLKYGLNNLHSMPETHLDIMDPYQKDANSLIWKSMMDGHEMLNRKEFTTTNPDEDIDTNFSETNYLGSSSNHQETILNINGKQVPSTTPAPTAAPVRSHFGPMVVKVHPDGRPVDEATSLPIDDDLHHYVMQTKVPSLFAFRGRYTNVVPTQQTDSYFPFGRSRSTQSN